MSLHKQADCLALPGTPPQAGPSSDESESTRPQRVTQLDGPWNHRGFKDGKVDSERLGSLLAAKVDPEDSSLPRLFSNFFQAMSAFDSTALQLQRLEKLLNGRRRADLVLKALGFPNSLYYHSQPHGESREAVSILAPMLLADRLALLAEPENLAEPLRGGKPQLNWSPISPDRSTFTDWWASLQAARKLYLVNRDTFDDVGGGKLICQKFIQQARSTRTARVRLNLEVFVYLLKRYLKGDPFLKPETIRSFVIEEADKVLEDEEEVQRLISQFDLIEIITPLFVAVIYGSCSLFSRHGFVTRKGCLYLPVWLQQSNIPSREAGNGLTVLDDTLLLLALRAALGKISIAQMSAAFFTDPKVMAILEQDPGWDARQVLRNDQERAEVVKSGTVVKSEQEFQRLTPFLIPAPQNIVAHEHPLYTSGAGVPPAPTRFFLQPDVEEVKFKGNDYPTHVQGDSRTVLLQRLPENTSHQREKSPRSSLDAETAENVVSKTVPDGTSSALTAQDDVLESMSEEEEEVMKMVIVKGMDIMGKAEHNSNERLGQQKQEKTKDQGRGQKQQVHDKQARNVRNQKKDNSNEVLQNDTDRSLRNEQKQMQREAADAKKRKRLVQAGNEEHEEDDALSGGILPITRKRRREDNVGGSAPTASDGETQATASSAPSSFSVPPSTAKESDAELVWQRVRTDLIAANEPIPTLSIAARFRHIYSKSLKDYRAAQGCLQRAVVTNDNFVRSCANGPPPFVTNLLKLPHYQLVENAATVEDDPRVVSALVAAEAELSTAARVITDYVKTVYAVQSDHCRKQVNTTDAAEHFAAELTACSTDLISNAGDSDPPLYEHCISLLKAAYLREIGDTNLEHTALTMKHNTKKEAKALQES